MCSQPTEGLERTGHSCLEAGTATPTTATLSGEGWPSCSIQALHGLNKAHSYGRDTSFPPSTDLNANLMGKCLGQDLAMSLGYL